MVCRNLQPRYCRLPFARRLQVLVVRMRDYQQPADPLACRLIMYVDGAMVSRATPRVPISFLLAITSLSGWARRGRTARSGRGSERCPTKAWAMAQRARLGAL